MENQPSPQLDINSQVAVHDLANILTGILGQIALLDNDLRSILETHLHTNQSVQIDAIRALHQRLQPLSYGATRARELVGLILDGSHEHGRCDLGDGISAALRFFESSLRLAATKITLEHNISLPPGLQVALSFTDISRIIINLLTNARDALPEGGQIWVTAKVKPPVAVIICRDNGAGIPDSMLAKIFEPHFSTKQQMAPHQRIGRRGLGLVGVRSIVESCGGHIAVSSRADDGCCFEITLPVVATNSVNSGEGIPISGTQCLGPLTGIAPRVTPAKCSVLVVEDEIAVSTVIQQGLEAFGFEVEVARTRADAIAKYAARYASSLQASGSEAGPQLGSFDLVILDMIMPNTSGDEIFRDLKAIDDHVAVLISSGYSSDERISAILDNGGLGLLRKPFAIDELVGEVKRCIQAKK